MLLNLPELRVFLTVFLLALAHAGDVVYASNAGGPDHSFGTNGLVSTEFGGAFDGVNAILAQPDGKILAMGTGGPSNRCALARYLPNGMLDESFSTDGKIIFDQSLSCSGLAVGPSGTVYAGMGYATLIDSDRGYQVVRLDDQGNFDASFGVGGRARAFMGTQPRVTGLAVQSDGKIVAAGWSYFNGEWNWGLARFHENGAIDASFAGGTVITDVNNGSMDRLEGLLIQPDDKTVVGGTTEDAMGRDVHALARYNTDGELDTTFGAGGKVILPYMATFAGEYISGLLLLPDGKILACGTGSHVDSILERFHADGSLDDSFGDHGRVVVEMGIQNNGFAGIVLDRAGRIVAGGTATSGNISRPALARFSFDGVLDPTFGDQGKVFLSWGGSYEYGGRVALASDGHVLMGGASGTANVDTDFVVVKRLSEKANPNDVDDDGVPNAEDNCATVPNPQQNDFDGDGQGDACDPDIDGDSVDNKTDVCNATPPGALTQPNGTLRADLDGDCDVDLADFDIMQVEFTGTH